MGDRHLPAWPASPRSPFPAVSTFLLRSGSFSDRIVPFSSLPSPIYWVVLAQNEPQPPPRGSGAEGSPECGPPFTRSISDPRPSLRRGARREPVFPGLEGPRGAPLGVPGGREPRTLRSEDSLRSGAWLAGCGCAP